MKKYSACLIDLKSKQCTWFHDILVCLVRAYVPGAGLCGLTHRVYLEIHRIDDVKRLRRSLFPNLSKKPSSLLLLLSNR
jgi:hypothetical protein